MCSTNSPTCVLSGSCVQDPQRGVLSSEIATISSEIESSQFFCGDQHNTTPPISGHGRCCPMTGILPAITRSHDIAEEPQQNPPASSSPSTSKSSKSNKSCGWKTSKFFSKTMSSGEILRGLKKLSLTSSSGSTSDTGDIESGKPRKSKSGQLKKRSSTGNDDVVVEDDTKARSPRSPGSFRPLSKAMSVSEPGSSSKSSNLGIVCRKEDLKAILCTASKKFPLASPSRRRHHHQAPLRQTKSASFEDRGSSFRNKEPFRRAGSEEAHHAKKPHHHHPIEKNNETTPLQTTVESVVTEPQPTTEAVDRLNEKNVARQSEAVELGGDVGPVASMVEGSLSTVKWDECEVVDAVIIGDAIESFLKGSMCGSEKKVSFRRSSDRKTKSDG